MNRILDAVPCPYKTLVQYSVQGVGTSKHIYRASKELRKYCAATAFHTHTAFLIRADSTVHENSIRGLASLFHTVVFYANSEGPNQLALYEKIEEPNWRLVISGVALFAVTMSPCYPPEHPRHNAEQTILLFQPESQFSFFGITTNSNRMNYTETALKSFERAGRKYFRHHDIGTPKSKRFVLDGRGRGVSWWECPLLPVNSQCS